MSDNEFSDAFSTAFDPLPAPTDRCILPVDASCCEEWDGYDGNVQQRATDMAWATLRTLTAGRVGNCPITVRPCRKGCGPNPTYQAFPVTAAGAGYVAGVPWTPVLVDGAWINTICGCGADGCSCTTVCEVVLPGEVAEVIDVQVGGALVDPDHYRIDDGNRLVAQGEGPCWPLCQNMSAPLGGEDTFGVHYRPGVDPGPLGYAAAGMLACEFALACTGKKCRLPANVVQVSRLGVTLTMEKGAGTSGIPEVDLFVETLNPYRLAVPSVVWSPSTPKGRTQTWP